MIENNNNIMIALKPHCKINIGLRIGNTRPDGYHNIETVMCPIALSDDLTIKLIDEKEQVPDGYCHLIEDGPFATNCPPEDNLCVRAYRVLEADAGKLPPIRIHLQKHIPSGAGLGGGSSDAVAVLLGLNHLLNLGYSITRLKALSVKLGADCPFFFHSHEQLATGIGDVLTSIRLPLSNYHIFVVMPKDCSVSTAEAYRFFDKAQPSEDSITDLVELPLTAWKYYVHNDFETYVFQKHPICADIKKRLYSLGAKYASMTGSGSALFALFDKDTELPQAKDFPNCFTWQSTNKRWYLVS